MRRRIFGLALTLLVLAGPFAGALTIKLGSLFPEGSPWDITLKRMAADWREISGGRVTVRIYPGGIAGNEEDMIRKMRINQLDAATLTSIGMRVVVPDTFVISLPFVIQSDNELDYVLENLMPSFDGDFNQAGFQLLTWSKSGWVRIFAKSPVVYPRDLKRQRLGMSDYGGAFGPAFKALGFQTELASVNDTLIGLQSGLLDACLAPPVGAAAYQWFGVADNMLDMDALPLVGGIIISQRTWRRIPSDIREELLESARRVGVDFAAQSDTINEQALDVMLDNGLKVQEAGEDVVTTWRNLFPNDYELVVGPGKLVSRSAYDRLVDTLTDYRN